MSAFMAKRSGSFKMEHNVGMSNSMDLVSNRGGFWVVEDFCINVHKEHWFVALFSCFVKNHLREKYL